MGEPGGVGAEITIKAYQALAKEGPAFFYCGSAALLEGTTRALRLQAPLVNISEPAQARSAFKSGLPILDMPLPSEIMTGAASLGHAGVVVKSIETAVRFALSGQAGGIVTDPIRSTACTRLASPIQGIPNSSRRCPVPAPALS